jgi:hypothetical protein
MAQDEELDYISTSPFSTAPVQVKSQDEEDLPTIKRLQKTLQDQITTYETVYTLTVDEKDFTVKQQLANNQQMVLRLKELQAIVDTTINNIREKYRG